MQRRPKHIWEGVFSAQQEDSKDAGRLERGSVVIGLVAPVPRPGASQSPEI